MVFDEVKSWPSPTKEGPSELKFASAVRRKLACDRVVSSDTHNSLVGYAVTCTKTAANVVLLLLLLLLSLR